MVTRELVHKGTVVAHRRRAAAVVVVVVTSLLTLRPMHSHIWLFDFPPTVDSVVIEWRSGEARGWK